MQPIRSGNRVRITGPMNDPAPIPLPEDPFEVFVECERCGAETEDPGEFYLQVCDGCAAVYDCERTAYEPRFTDEHGFDRTPGRTPRPGQL
jgi:hypothetical protein